MKHLLVMIQYAGENNNVTAKIATINMNNITGTTEHIDNLHNLHTVICSEKIQCIKLCHVRTRIPEKTH